MFVVMIHNLLRYLYFYCTNLVKDKYREKKENSRQMGFHQNSSIVCFSSYYVSGGGKPRKRGNESWFYSKDKINKVFLLQENSLIKILKWNKWNYYQWIILWTEHYNINTLKAWII